MKNCRKIRRELSAYLDGELAPSLRANVEEHLTSCAQCQQELSEMKTLATGLAALPNLRPAPRFLTEVRRKIVRGEKPEPLTWRDYAFRPMWLKIPLEVAALVLIVGLIMRGQNSEPTDRVTVFKPGRPYEGDNGSANNSSSEAATKPEPVETLKSVIVDRPPAAEIPQDRPAAPEAQPEVSATREVREKEENRVDTTETAGSAIASEDKKSVEQSAVNTVVAGRMDDQSTDGARSAPAFHGGELSSLASASSPSPIIGAIGSVESAQPKPGETVTVHAQDFEDVQNRAQRLAVRCGGRIIAVPQSKDGPEQTFFVELPREYVAAFKLELLKVPTSPVGGGTVNESVPNSAGAPTGVLTGNAVTNNSINAPAPLGLRNDATAPASTAVLEIRVVAPSD